MLQVRSKNFPSKCEDALQLGKLPERNQQKKRSSGSLRNGLKTLSYVRWSNEQLGYYLRNGTEREGDAMSLDSRSSTYLERYLLIFGKNQRSRVELREFPNFQFLNSIRLVFKLKNVIKKQSSMALAVTTQSLQKMRGYEPSLLPVAYFLNL